ncbi:MFS transporter [Ferrimonas marina]|uniref:Predicted arabinose efflux permease, MFS family n=1 Tax=Ferrimonas marina TaxID=299255 RepID=A0A1M5VV68_9GAMM|nr:MFS transporter [Ferrimonas marina]SHH79080.1 Predicted arabinose efflux permease, MFS family [Ferrimonas marina]
MIDVGTRSYQRARLALTLGALMVFGNLYLFQPLLPELAQLYQVSPSQANWAHAACFMGLALGLLPWALLSERVGRRRVMLLSLGLIPLVGAAGAMAEAFWQIALARALMGAVLAGFASVAVAYMAEEFSPKALALAVGGFVAANSIGGILSRLAGGGLGDLLGWRGTVLIIGACSALALVGVLRWLPQDACFRPSRHGLRVSLKQTFRHLANPKLVLAMWIGGLNFALFVNQFSAMGFRLVAEPHSLPLAVTSLIFLCYLSGTFTSSFSGRWSLRFGDLSGMLLGTLVAFAGVLLARQEVLWSMILGMLLISAGAFLVHALAYAWVGKHALTAKAGATALYLVHYYVGGSVGGFWLLWCWQQWGWDGVIAGSGVCYCAMLMLVGALTRNERRLSEQALA